MDFYDTLLHEIAHSTEHPSRLNRPSHVVFEDSAYAREELVAELTSALCGTMLGLSVTPQAENAAYLNRGSADCMESRSACSTYLSM